MVGGLTPLQRWNQHILQPILTGLTTQDNCGLESNDNEGVVHTLERFKTGAPILDAILDLNKDTILLAIDRLIDCLENNGQFQI